MRAERLPRQFKRIIQFPPKIEQFWRCCTNRGHSDLRALPKLDRIAIEGESRDAQRSADLLQHRELVSRHFADKGEGHMVILRIDPAATALKIQLARNFTELPCNAIIRPERKE